MKRRKLFRCLDRSERSRGCCRKVAGVKAGGSRCARGRPAPCAAPRPPAADRGRNAGDAGTGRRRCSSTGTYEVAVRLHGSVVAAAVGRHRPPRRVWGARVRFAGHDDRRPERQGPTTDTTNARGDASTGSSRHQSYGPGIHHQRRRRCSTLTGPPRVGDPACHQGRDAPTYVSYVDQPNEAGGAHRRQEESIRTVLSRRLGGHSAPECRLHRPASTRPRRGRGHRGQGRRCTADRGGPLVAFRHRDARARAVGDTELTGPPGLRKVGPCRALRRSTAGDGRSRLIQATRRTPRSGGAAPAEPGPGAPAGSRRPTTPSREASRLAARRRATKARAERQALLGAARPREPQAGARAPSATARCAPTHGGSRASRGATAASKPRSGSMRDQRLPDRGR